MKKLEEINQRLIKGQEKLKQIKERYNTDSKKIAESIQKRAILLADEALESDPKRKKEIDELNKEIGNLKEAVESQGPELISALEKKIQRIQSEKQNEEIRLSFEKQKKLGDKLVDLSKNLIEGLESCKIINGELRKIWLEYANLSKVTDKGAIKPGSKTTQGSFECLHSLVAVLSYEYNQGKPRSCDQARIMQW